VCEEKEKKEKLKLLIPEYMFIMEAMLKGLILVEKVYISTNT
jgi:hypothetical protein